MEVPPGHENYNWSERVRQAESVGNMKTGKISKIPKNNIIGLCNFFRILVVANFHVFHEPKSAFLGCREFSGEHKIVCEN